MTIFDALNMLGGLCLFLFGMNIMGQALEKRAGGRLKTLLKKMTGNKLAGFLTGLGVTAVIQSSSATTVMVVGFVNSGIMSLRQAINVIMGANVGTTVTAWLLSLSGISGDSIFVKLLKPSSFTPVLALIGIIFYMFSKNSRRKDTGLILLGFATLMFGMETMSSSVSGLKNMESFRQLFTAFENPILGVLAGALLTAIIQSSSASVGILQALAVTGQVSVEAAIPIIMGQNIGTCVTALISSVGANRGAKRAAAVHLSFNVIGTAVWLTVFCIVKAVVNPAVLDTAATMTSIAILHSAFNILCTAIMLPCAGLLEKLAYILVKDKKEDLAQAEILDERLMATPPIALGRCREQTMVMAEAAGNALKLSLDCLTSYTAEKATAIREAEELTDRYEDAISTYLVKLSTKSLNAEDSETATALLKYVGDFERIADHASDVLDSCEELREKKLKFSDGASAELKKLTDAVTEIIDMSLEAFKNDDAIAASRVEPLEQVIDGIKEELRTRHILRMRQGICGAEAGFVWSDLLTNLERVSDHCSNVAGCVMDLENHRLTLHDTLRREKEVGIGYEACFEEYSRKYALKDITNA